MLGSVVDSLHACADSFVLQHQSMFARHAVMTLESMRGQADFLRVGLGRVDFLAGVDSRVLSILVKIKNR